MRKKFNLYCKRKKEKMIRFYHPYDAQKKWIETITSKLKCMTVFFFLFFIKLTGAFCLILIVCLFIIPHSFCFWCRYCKNLFVWEWCFTIFSLPISLMDFPYSLFFFSFPYVLVVRISSKIKQYLLADISLYSHCSSLIASKWIIALRRTKLLSAKGFLTN